MSGDSRFKTRFSTPPPFVVYPAPLDFQPNQAREFYQYVMDLNDRTHLLPIMEPKDIRLDSDGCITCERTKYRLSIQAFTELCSRLSPGLATLAKDISGVRRREGSIDEVVSPKVAAEIINACAELRFRMKDGIFSRQLILDTKTKVVDGIVGPKYRYLAHCDLYEAVDQMMGGSEIPVYFAYARLIGRRLAMYYQMRGVQLSLSNGHTWSGGYYFANSEAGECGVHSSELLINAQTGLRVLGPMQQLAHSGKGFLVKLTHVLNEVFARGAELPEKRQGGEKLLDTHLQVFDAAGRVDKTIRKTLEHSLMGQNLAKKYAADVIRGAIYAGGTSSIPLSASRHDINNRTHYDVFLRLAYEAEQWNLSTRESMERIAFLLLNGDFSL